MILCTLNRERRRRSEVSNSASGVYRSVIVIEYGGGREGGRFDSIVVLDLPDRDTAKPPPSRNSETQLLPR